MNPRQELIKKTQDEIRQKQEALDRAKAAALELQKELDEKQEQLRQLVKEEAAPSSPVPEGKARGDTAVETKEINTELSPTDKKTETRKRRETFLEEKRKMSEQEELWKNIKVEIGSRKLTHRDFLGEKDRLKSEFEQAVSLFNSQIINFGKIIEILQKTEREHKQNVHALSLGRSLRRILQLGKDSLSNFLTLTALANLSPAPKKSLLEDSIISSATEAENIKKILAVSLEQFNSLAVGHQELLKAVSNPTLKASTFQEDLDRCINELPVPLTITVEETISPKTQKTPKGPKSPEVKSPITSPSDSPPKKLTYPEAYAYLNRLLDHFKNIMEAYKEPAKKQKQLKHLTNSIDNLLSLISEEKSPNLKGLTSLKNDLESCKKYIGTLKSSSQQLFDSTINSEIDICDKKIEECTQRLSKIIELNSPKP